MNSPFSHVARDRNKKRKPIPLTKAQIKEVIADQERMYQKPKPSECDRKAYMKQYIVAWKEENREKVREYQRAYMKRKRLKGLLKVQLNSAYMKKKGITRNLAHGKKPKKKRG